MYIIKNIKRIGMTAVLVGVIGMSLAACGDSPTATPLPQPTNTSAPAVDPTAMPEATQGTSDEMQEVKLTIKEWKIEPASVELKPGKVRITVTNTGTFSHNITVLKDGNVVGATPTFASSESPMVLELTLAAGDYDMLCSLPGHASQGQRGTITVK